MGHHTKPAILSTADRSAWLRTTGEAIRQEFTAKFVAGAVEHGTDLGEVSVRGLIDEMEKEALDQLAYCKELRRRLDCQTQVENAVHERFNREVSHEGC